MKILEMFEKIVQNDNIKMSDTININEKKIGTYHIWHATRQEIQTALEEKLYFLIPPCVEHFLDCYMEASSISLNDVVNGTAEAALQDIDAIRTYIKENHMNDAWDSTSKEIVRCINELGLKLLPDLYADSYAMCQILLNAAAFAKRLMRAHKIQGGHSGKPGPVKLMTRICRYDHMEDFIGMLHLESLPDKCISFGAYYPTNKDTDSQLYKYIHGYPDERTRNVMHNEQLSLEEAEAQLNPSRAAILVGIKNGENIWVMSCTNSDIVCSESFFGYGDGYDRRSYLPYQLFFDPENFISRPVEADKNYPAIKFAGWSMQDILDEEQAVWMVGLYQILIHSEFFTESSKTDTMLLPGCMVRVDIPKEKTKLPQLYSHVAPDMEKCISEKEKWLLGYCGIDLNKLPFELCEPRYSGEADTFRSIEDYRKSVNTKARWLIEGTLEKCFEQVYTQEQDMLDSFIRNRFTSTIDWEHMEKYFKFMMFYCNHSRRYNAADLFEPVKSRYRGDTTIGTYDISAYCQNNRIVIRTKNAATMRMPSVIMVMEPRYGSDWAVLLDLPETNLPVSLRYWEYQADRCKIKEKHRRTWVYGAKKDLKELLHFDAATIEEIRKIV